MPRRQVRNNNWTRLGQLILDIWGGKVAKSDLRAKPTEMLRKYGVRVDDKTKIKVHFDTEHVINVVIPHNVRSDAELKACAENEAYKRELGVVMMGGCR